MIRSRGFARTASLALFILVAFFYIYTLQPSLSWGDGTRLQREAITGESFILAELVNVEFAPDPFPFARLGVAAWDHPLYVMLAHTLVRLFAGVDSLRLVNSLSAVFGAAAIVVVFRLCYVHTRSMVASLFASLSLAVSHTFWWHAATPEVYTLFVFLLLLSLYLCDQYERMGQRAALAGGLFVLGLAASNHPLTFLAFPAGVLYCWMSAEPPAGRKTSVFFEHLGGLARHPWRAVLPALAFLAGFSPYIIQLLRMLRTFPLARVMGSAAGSTFLRGLLATTPLLLGKSILTYLMFLTLQFGPVGVALGLYGLRGDTPACGPLRRQTLAFYSVYTLFGILYQVADQFAFFLTSHVFWALAMGMGVARLAAALPEGRRRLLTGGLSLAILVMPPFYRALPGLARAAGATDATFGIPEIGTGVRDGLVYYLNPDKRGDTTAYQFGQETLESVSPDAVVLAEWYTDTDEYFVLRYFITVEHLRPDVEIVGWPLEDPFAFDSTLALGKVERELLHRPVYLASLSEAYYAASALAEKYCIVPEAHLYRVYPDDPETLKAEGIACQGGRSQTPLVVCYPPRSQHLSRPACPSTASAAA